MKIDPDWSGALQHPKMERRDLPEADHTCSEPAQQAQLEDAMIAWLDALTIPTTMTPASAAQVPNGRHATRPVAGRAASSPTR
ncbi:MAG: hypothetical protein OEM00_13045 [Burkholderiaceae bacterium]|nr:hypothetical protein [Burkholderiaceae bacterium]